MSEVVSLREFARRRDVSLRAVQKAIESGRVTAVERDPDGRLKGIQFEAATAQWNRNTDPVEALKNGQLLAPAAAPVAPAPDGDLVDQAASPPAAAPAASEAEDAGPGFHQHRTEREMFAAKTAALDYYERAGLLTSAAGVRKASFDTARQVREQLLNIPDRMASVLAAMTDPVMVHETLTKEIKLVLNGLTQPTEPARGPGIGE